jgi:hypothetical protein
VERAEELLVPWVLVLVPVRAWAEPVLALRELPAEPPAERPVVAPAERAQLARLPVL